MAEEIKEEDNKNEQVPSLNPPSVHSGSHKEKTVGFEQEPSQDLDTTEIKQSNIVMLEILVRGLIEWGQFNDADGISCSYELVAGDSWIKHKGISTGTSQHAYKSFNSQNRLVWNFPFEIYYNATEPIGWPQLILTFTKRDFIGREVLAGYGNTHIPLQEGT